MLVAAAAAAAADKLHVSEGFGNCCQLHSAGHSCVQATNLSILQMHRAYARPVMLCFDETPAACGECTLLLIDQACPDSQGIGDHSNMSDSEQQCTTHACSRKTLTLLVSTRPTLPLEFLGFQMHASLCLVHFAPVLYRSWGVRCIDDPC